MAESNIRKIKVPKGENDLIATLKGAQEAIAKGEIVSEDQLNAAEESARILERLERLANTHLEAGLEEDATSILNGERKLDRALQHETREIFRLNSGFALDLSEYKAPVEQFQIKWDHAILCQDKAYLEKALNPGVYVILGENGTAKTTLARNIASAYPASYHKVLEPMDPGEDPSTIAVTDAEIQAAFKSAVTSPSPVAIIDSLSFVSLSATGFPSMEKSINPASFKLCLWLDIIASRAGRVIFVIINTEREDDYVFNLFKGALKGKTQGLLCLTSKGRGEMLRRDIDRTFMRSFEVKDLTGTLNMNNVEPSASTAGSDLTKITIERI